jgi:hypothetical protein
MRLQRHRQNFGKLGLLPQLQSPYGFFGIKFYAIYNQSMQMGTGSGCFCFAYMPVPLYAVHTG